MNFDALDTEEKAQKFRKKRLRKINKGKIWSPMSEGPYCVLHWLPISKDPLFKLDNLNRENFSKFFSIEPNKAEMPNLDGIRFYSSMKDEISKAPNNLPNQTYKQKLRHFWNAQVFPSGALEMTFALSFQENESDKEKDIQSSDIVMRLWRDMDEFKKCMSYFNIDVPIVVGVSLLRILDYRLSFHYVTLRNLHAHSDRKKIILPGKRIERLQDIGQVESPIFDMLWRSFGYGKCPYYDDDGNRRNFR